jgi:hypothetical protein
MRQRRVAVTAAAAVACLVAGACSDGSSSTATAGASPPATAESRSACAAPPVAAPRPGEDRTATVFLLCGEASIPPVDLVAVERLVPDDGAPLAAAMRQLLSG